MSTTQPIHANQLDNNREEPSMNLQPGQFAHIALANNTLLFGQVHQNDGLFLGVLGYIVDDPAYDVWDTADDNPSMYVVPIANIVFSHTGNTYPVGNPFNEDGPADTFFHWPSLEKTLSQMEAGRKLGSHHPELFAEPATIVFHDGSETFGNQWEATTAGLKNTHDAGISTNRYNVKMRHLQYRFVPWSAVREVVWQDEQVVR